MSIASQLLILFLSPVLSNSDNKVYLVVIYLLISLAIAVPSYSLKGFFNPCTLEQGTACIRYGMNGGINVSGGMNISVDEVLNLKFWDERFD